MNSLSRFLILVAVWPWVGCSGYEPSAPPPAKNPPAPQAAQKPGTAAPSVSGGAARPGPVALSTQPSAPIASPSSGAPQPIQLSAGTALPQTLPDGTAMGFSVDYQFTQGQPEANAQYFWVIERSQGAATKQPVRLQARGTLQGFVTDFRPEQGPFQTHLEDARGTRLSATVPLR